MLLQEHDQGLSFSRAGEINTSGYLRVLCPCVPRDCVETEWVDELVTDLWKHGTRVLSRCGVLGTSETLDLKGFSRLQAASVSVTKLF